MGFHVPDSDVRAVGYAAGFSQDQIVRNLGSEYDVVYVFETPSEASTSIVHHSEAVYEISITVRKVED